ncbi:MAG TPA: hypothetical protein PKC87_01295, partial [Candidatus Absconditabacterales bacterium]|nr:hypothetical protein [Candidatus Absconditabacterales bacterium]
MMFKSSLIKKILLIVFSLLIIGLGIYFGNNIHDIFLGTSNTTGDIKEFGNILGQIDTEGNSSQFALSLTSGTTNTFDTTTTINKKIPSKNTTKENIIYLPDSNSVSTTKTKLINNGYNDGTGSLKPTLNNFLVGKKSISTRDSLGKILYPIIIQSIEETNTIEVQIPEGTILKTIDDNLYTGILHLPQVKDTTNVSLPNIVFVASFGSTEENIIFQDANDKPANVTIR